MITDKHRKFYVNGKLEFALFYDPKEKNKQEIEKNFLDSHMWKSWANYCNLKVISVDISKDLKEVYITAKECNDEEEIKETKPRKSKKQKTQNI